MKKIYYVIVLSLLFLTSCNTCVEKNEATSGENVTEHNEFLENQTEVNTFEESISTVIDWSSIIFEEGEVIDLPQARLKNVVVSKKTRMNSAFDKKNEQFVYLLNDCHTGCSQSFNSYLLVEVGLKALVYNLKTSSYCDQLYACDVDGNKIDEIILHQALDFTGGAGQHISRIFKIQENELCEIFNSRIDLLTKTEKTFDTGFRSEFLDGKKLKISNSITGYNCILDISERYISDFFDKNGKGIIPVSVECDSFYEFQPKDHDEDGIFEIDCLQYASLLTHGDGIGEARSVLKYNEKTREMEVIESSFSFENSL